VSAITHRVTNLAASRFILAAPAPQSIEVDTQLLGNLALAGISLPGQLHSLMFELLGKSSAF